MKALILLGGTPPPAVLVRTLAAQADTVLCADSGLHAALQAGVEPDVVMGDMDSVNPETLSRYSGRTMRLPCEKDDTDGVAALDYAIRQGAGRIVITGALGGRMDHALANCMLLVRAAKHGVNACIEEDSCRIELLRGDHTLRGSKGQTFSLLPIGDAHIASLEGAHYPLLDYGMSCDYPIGVSNLFEEDTIRIRIQSGNVLFFQIKE